MPDYCLCETPMQAKKDLEVIRKGRAQFVPEVRGEHRKLGSGVTACSTVTSSAPNVSYVHGHGILQT